MNFKEKIHPNPNKEILNKIEQAIKENDGYCCCSLLKTENTKCMCKKFREQDHSGYCHCERFYKEIIPID